MHKKDCPCPNKNCSIKGNCIECVRAHSEKGFIPYCIYINNGEKVYNPDCGCTNTSCQRHGDCEACVRHHGLKGNLTSCLR
jgi:hypothetical protein